MRFQRLMIVSATVAALAVSGCGFSGGQGQARGASVGGSFTGKPVAPPTSITGLATVDLATVKAEFAQTLSAEEAKKGASTFHPKIEAHPEWSVKPADSTFGAVVKAPVEGATLGSVDTILSAPVSFKPMEPLNFPLWNRGVLSLKKIQDRGLKFTVKVTNTMSTNLDLSKFKLDGIANSESRFCRWLTGGAFTEEQILGYPTGDDGFSPVLSLEPGQSAEFDAALACQVPKGTDLEVDLKFASSKTVKPRIFRTKML